jgi:hypothetical protein
MGLSTAYGKITPYERVARLFKESFERKQQVRSAPVQTG